MGVSAPSPRRPRSPDAGSRRGAAPAAVGRRGAGRGAGGAARSRSGAVRRGRRRSGAGGVGDRADALRARRRPGSAAVLRALPLRSLDRAVGARRPRTSSDRRTGAIPGAGMGDLRAADRGRAGGGDPAPTGGDARAPVSGGRDARCAERGRARGCGAGAARVVWPVGWPGRHASARRPRGRLRAGRPAPPRPRARVAKVARDSRDRELDRGEARAHRAGAPRSAPGGGPRLPEAGRAAAGRRSLGAGDRGRGRVVLRAVRAVGGAGGGACAASRR